MKPVDVDIEDVLEDVFRVLNQRETGRSQNYSCEVRETENVTFLLPGVWQNITDSLLSLHQSLEPLEKEATPGELPESKGLPGSVRRFLKRLIRKSVYWYVNPVVAQLQRMHSATDRALSEIADQLKNIDERLLLLEGEKLADRLKDLEGERLDERIGRLERVGSKTPGETTRLDVPITGEEDQHPDTGRGQGIEREGEVEDRIREGDRSKPFPLFDFDYYWFEGIHRGDRELIKARQQPYLEYFKGCRNVLDVGCGRGQFLELMHEKGIKGYGIDIDGDAVKFCADARLEARREEAIEHLSRLPGESLDGVLISQVAEHLTSSELIELIGLTFQKMISGSYIVVETPNPQCLLIFASFFYADLSHVQPVHPETMRFLLLSTGFKDVQIKFTNPVPRKQRLGSIIPTGVSANEPWVEELNRNLDKLNSVLFGYTDYAAIAHK